MGCYSWDIDGILNYGYFSEICMYIYNMRDMNGNIIMGYNGIVQLLSPSTATPKRIVRKEYSTFNLVVD